MSKTDQRIHILLVDDREENLVSLIKETFDAREVTE